MKLVAAQVAAFVRRDWVVTRSYRFPFLISLVTSVVMLLVLHQIGKLVDASPHARSSDLGDGYFAYVLVGMAVLGVVHSALQSFATKLREEQTTGTLEALLATPASPSVVILGSAAYDLVQAVATGVILVLFGLTTGIHVVLTPLSLLITLLALLGLVGLFAALGVAVAAFTVVYKRGSTLTALVTGGLALLGGVYFPIALLPQPFRFLAEILPFTWGVDALRRALLFGQVDALKTAGMIISAVVTLPVALWLFKVAVTHARRMGSLAQY
jgi:ABC-type polysaccharide/polyol phosphate export permease